jgi:hypothetical protein
LFENESHSTHPDLSAMDKLLPRGEIIFALDSDHGGVQLAAKISTIFPVIFMKSYSAWRVQLEGRQRPSVGKTVSHGFMFALTPASLCNASRDNALRRGKNQIIQ